MFWCTDCAVNYTAQPPTEFDCNPTGQRILLRCVVTPLNTSVSWYHTSDPIKAGLQGDELMDDVDGYSVMDNSFGAGRREDLGFTISNLTIGFYWCGITGGDYRSSTITPISTQFNSTLPMCDIFTVNQQISDVHHYETECAEVDSPTQFPRPPFPENCISVPSPSLVNTIDHSDSSTILTILSSRYISFSTLTISSPSLVNTIDYSDSFGSTILTILSSRSISFSTLTISSPSLVNTIDHSDAFGSTILTILSSRSVSSSTLTASLLSISSTSIPAVESCQSCNEQKVIFGLIGVCVFLAVVTMMTCGAFIMYCFLTKANGVHGIKGKYYSFLHMHQPNVWLRHVLNSYFIGFCIYVSKFS